MSSRDEGGAIWRKRWAGKSRGRRIASTFRARDASDNTVIAGALKNALRDALAK
jgi:hypothetical protein